MSQVIDATRLTSQDVAAIRATTEPWANACVRRDWDRLLAMCTDDIVFLPPNEPVVEHGGVRSWLDNFPTIKQMSIGIERIEGAGLLACVRGSVRMMLEISGQQVPFDGKYIDVFRKQPDGSWRFAQVMWSANTV